MTNDTDIRDVWACGCGRKFTDEAEANAHLGPGHPWLSRMIDEAMVFIHEPGDDWMFAEVEKPAISPANVPET